MRRGLAFVLAAAMTAAMCPAAFGATFDKQWQYAPGRTIPVNAACTVDGTKLTASSKTNDAATRTSEYAFKDFTTSEDFTIEYDLSYTGTTGARNFMEWQFRKYVKDGWNTGFTILIFTENNAVTAVIRKYSWNGTTDINQGTTSGAYQNGNNISTQTGSFSLAPGATARAKLECKGANITFTVGGLTVTATDTRLSKLKDEMFDADAANVGANYYNGRSLTLSMGIYQNALYPQIICQKQLFI
ncbi:hypothetical protein FACS189492_2630 [Clostridia bacterium]|nr:hypothetical protein FACS189492_2630 [Clostridia bacterium]